MDTKNFLSVGALKFLFPLLEMLSPRYSHASPHTFKAFLGCHLSSEASLGTLSIIGAHALFLFPIPLKIFSFLSLFFTAEEFVF